MSEEALRTAEKTSERQRRKGKTHPSEGRAPKNSKERSDHFLSDQCKETEENYRMGKTRDLSKEMRYQGNISCTDGHKEGKKQYGPNRSRKS